MDKTFEEVLKEEYEELDFLSEENEIVDAECFFLLDESELLELQEEMGYTDEEMDILKNTLEENLRRRVNSAGKVSKVRSRQVRSRRAVQTTGMSRSQLKRRARRAAITKKRNPAMMRKALKKRRKALRKRKSMGIR